MAPNAARAAVLWCMCERVWPECAIARRRSAPLRPWQNVLEQARAARAKQQVRDPVRACRSGARTRAWRIVRHALVSTLRSHRPYSSTERLRWPLEGRGAEAAQGMYRLRYGRSPTPDLSEDDLLAEGCKYDSRPYGDDPLLRVRRGLRCLPASHPIFLLNRTRAVFSRLSACTM